MWVGHLGLSGLFGLGPLIACYPQGPTLRSKTYFYVNVL